MHIHGRTDANQTECVRVARQLGASVFDASALGGGFPDLIIGFRNVTHLVEVKDGKKTPSRRKLTPDQERFHREWNGEPVMVVLSPDDLLAFLCPPKPPPSWIAVAPPTSIAT